MNTLIKQSQQGSYSVTEVEVVDEETIAKLESANVIYSPEFIPFYVAEVRKYKFKYIEGLVYGFIRFYLGTNPHKKFYFTNEQLADMLDVSVATIKTVVPYVVETAMEFESELKMKASGGTYRLIYRSPSFNTFEVQKPILSKSKNLPANKNKLKENKLKNAKNNFFYSKQDNTYDKNEAERIRSIKLKETEDLLDGLPQFEKLKHQNVD